VNELMSAPQSHSKVGQIGALTDLLQDGMTLGIGGFGLDRKPMALVQAIAKSRVRELAIETFAGGLDVDALLAAGKVRKVSACHVGLDHFGLAPLFRTARQSGSIEFQEWSEWSQLVAWRAAAERVPYSTVAVDSQSELLKVNTGMRICPCPFTNATTAVVQAPTIDLAILHAEAAHPDGTAIAEADPYLDTLLARAARKVVLSTERLVDDAELRQRSRNVHLLGNYVDVVVLAERGALPGSCVPQYLLDLQILRQYVEAGSDSPSRAGELILNALRAPPRSAEV
jgi:glutaconate CoA-transferase, subunit A